jgi:hypothetical protein
LATPKEAIRNTIDRVNLERVKPDAGDGCVVVFSGVGAFGQGGLRARSFF